MISMLRKYACYVTILISN